MNCERERDWAGAVAAYRRAIAQGGGSKFGARMQAMQAAYYGNDDATVLAMADELDSNIDGATFPGGLSSIFRARVARSRQDWPAMRDAARTGIERIAANGGEINSGPVAVSRCEPQFLLGLALMQLEPDKAAPLFEEAIRIDPTYSESFEYLSQLCRAEGRLPHELLLRWQLVGLTDHGDDYYNLACALALSGMHDEALGALALSIERVPDNAQFAREDDDLASLRALDRFAQLTG